MGNKDLPPREHLLVFNQTVPMTARWWGGGGAFADKTPEEMGGLSPTEGLENLLKGPAQSIREPSPQVHSVPKHLGVLFCECQTRGLLEDREQVGSWRGCVKLSTSNYTKAALGKSK